MAEERFDMIRSSNIFLSEDGWAGTFHHLI
jgi:hypothetical protein